MATAIPRKLIEVTYEDYAQQYLRSLPLEHFMEATAQATQREITLESLALVKARRKDVHVFNELLVQYPKPGQRRPGQIVSDNTVVIFKGTIRASSSFNTPVEDASPFWVMEYVSKHNKRKDYKASFDKYERELKVPYYLTFYPDDLELTLYRHNGKKYVSVKPNREGRLAVSELDLEVALLDGWVRYWYKGKLLPLPADMQRELDEALHKAEQEKRRADDERRRADDLQRRFAEAERELAAYRSGKRNGLKNGK